MTSESDTKPASEYSEAEQLVFEHAVKATEGQLSESAHAQLKTLLETSVRLKSDVGPRYSNVWGGTVVARLIHTVLSPSRQRAATVRFQ